MVQMVLLPKNKSQSKVRLANQALRRKSWTFHKTEVVVHYFWELTLKAFISLMIKVH